MAGGNETAYGFVCVDCKVKTRAGLSYVSACRRASNHAAKQRGHHVFVLERGLATLDVYWYADGGQLAIPSS